MHFCRLRLGRLSMVSLPSWSCVGEVDALKARCRDLGRSSFRCDEAEVSRQVFCESRIRNLKHIITTRDAK